MKVIIPAAAFALAVVLLPDTASAQALGVGAFYDTEFEDPGIGANFVFHTGGVVDSSRLALDFKYWFVEDGFSYYTGNIDGQYLWFKGPQALSYGLIGLNVSTVTYDSDLRDNDIDLGLNLGAGAEFTLARAVALYAEAKLLISFGDIDSRLIAGGGLRFYFGGGGGGGGDLDLSDM